MKRFQSKKKTRMGILLLLLLPMVVSSFLHSGPARPIRVISQSLLRLVEDDQEVVFGSSGILDSSAAGTTNTDRFLMESLQNRQKEIQQGVGKRYVTRTQKGFLNVHYEPTDPHDINNVVGKLEEGQIVTSTGPLRGFWVRHEGGWSISKYGGFTWLEPIDE